MLGLLALVAACAGEEPEREPFLVISGPRAFTSVELREPDETTIWRLTADPPAPLTALFYGEVPPGFLQELPDASGPPRPLLPGEPLVVVSTTPDREFRHVGYAAGPGRFSIDTWEMRLRRPLDAGAGPS